MIQLKVQYICPPIPYRDFDYQVTNAKYDQGDVVGHGETIPKAIENWIDLYESKHDIDRKQIKYSWI
jgi:hypothetical protein